MRIMTGAPLPADADAIVMIEDTTIEGAHVRIGVDVRAGEHVRRRGEDVRAGSTARFRREKRYQQLGSDCLRRAAGLVEVRVRGGRRWQSSRRATRSPRPGRCSSQAKSTRRTTRCWRRSARRAVRSPSTVASRATIARRSRNVRARSICGLHRHHQQRERRRLDVVKDVLGDAIEFWKVRMKPGSQFAFGRFAGRPFFGLPRESGLGVGELPRVRSPGGPSLARQPASVPAGAQRCARHGRSRRAPDARSWSAWRCRGTADGSTHARRREDGLAHAHEYRGRARLRARRGGPDASRGQATIAVQNVRPDVPEIGARRVPLVNGYVLPAAGGRRAMGHDKAFVELERETARSASRMRCRRLSIACSWWVARSRSSSRLGFPVLFDRDAAFRHPLLGVEAALEDADGPALVGPCDVRVAGSRVRRPPRRGRAARGRFRRNAAPSTPRRAHAGAVADGPGNPRTSGKRARLARSCGAAVLPASALHNVNAAEDMDAPPGRGYPGPDELSRTPGNPRARCDARARSRERQRRYGSRAGQKDSKIKGDRLELTLAFGTAHSADDQDRMTEALRRNLEGIGWKGEVRSRGRRSREQVSLLPQRRRSRRSPSGE